MGLLGSPQLLPFSSQELHHGPIKLGPAHWPLRFGSYSLAETTSPIRMYFVPPQQRYCLLVKDAEL